ncbi:FixH family protein [Ammoniphilus sp. 3BR4]|uniref:FixH family protein n=1 Tax=Ammoniphilus sp. 3BR4 TaxID=3158265 RepID=UPI0034675C5C
MFKILLGILLIPGILIGCSQAPQEPEIPEAPVPITVEFKVEPELIKAGEIASLQVLVKQGEELVEDAQEVEFEIWKEGQEQHDIVEAENQGKGIYSFMERFHEAGTYHVMYHVTARDMHDMKPMEVVVAGEEQSLEHPAHEDSSAQHAQDHHHADVDIHYVPDKEAKVNQSQVFLAQILKDGKPLEGAVVRFEYWREDDSKHIFTDAYEGKSGEYAAEVALAEAGNYRVVTHVEKGDIHEHAENRLTVR